MATTKLADRHKLHAFLRRHNADMAALLADKARRDLMGLLKQRIEEAIFSATQIEKVLEMSGEGRLRLDQSDLGRLLSQLISPETCRKVTVVLAKGGLLTRRTIGTVLVVSTGVLEGYFRKHLQQILSTLELGAKP